jgi:hypothetical protein
VGEESGHARKQAVPEDDAEDQEDEHQAERQIDSEQA